MLQIYYAFHNNKRITIFAISRPQAKWEAVKRFGLKRKDFNRVTVIEAELLMEMS